jgi:hypothetical protein
MSEDLVRLVIDPQFPAPDTTELKDGEEHRENGFKLIHSGSNNASPMPGPRNESWFYPVGKSKFAPEVHTTSGKSGSVFSPRCPTPPAREVRI